jgi:hypothetical protein
MRAIDGQIATGLLKILQIIDGYIRDITLFLVGHMASHFHSQIAGRALVAGAMMVALSACATMPTPRNADLAAYQPQQASLPYGVNGPDGWRRRRPRGPVCPHAARPKCPQCWPV